MRLLGLTIARTRTLERTKAAVQPVALTPFEQMQMGRGGWFRLIGEAFPGAWQRNIAVSADRLQLHCTVYACLTLIASDISKMRITLLQRDANGISEEIENPAYSPVLRRPNHYQNRIQFLEHWTLSKLQAGNTYVLKERDARGVVTDLYVLDPCRVQVLVAPNGDVYYQLSTDYLSGLPQGDVTVPATEIIHDRMNCLFHPLCGIAPLAAAALPATQGLNIQRQSSRFFSKGAQLSGVLTAPGMISDAVAKRIQADWELNFLGEGNEGKVAVLGDGLKFDPMQMTSVNAQLIEQLKWTDEGICRAFHVPAYMVGVGAPPNYNNIEALNQQYYSQCLQNPIESIELGLEEGLATRPYEIELDLGDLLRMDTKTLVDTAVAEVRGGLATPNEARAIRNRRPLRGGETVYLQEQDHSLEWLARRDAMPIEPKASTAPASATKALETDQTDDLIAELEKAA